jgi:hypothetical protein
MRTTARRRERFESILLAYIRALNGRWPWHTNLAEVLQAISNTVPGVTAIELREAVRWSLRQSRHKGAELEAAMLRERDVMGDNVIQLNERLERAYLAALAGRAPENVDIVDLLPAILAALPDTNTQEIADALRWSARKNMREADKLEAMSRQWGGR